MKKYLLLLLITIPLCLKAQSNETIKEVDTMSIVFKAKLFTISKHDYKERKELINTIDNLLYTTYGNNEFIFIKIKSRYYCQDNRDMYTLNWCDCNYYVCYSIKKNVYYLLGGFEIDNIDEFAKEYKGSLFSANWSYKIDDKNLSEFIKQVAVEKLKKAKNCFDKCTETWD